MSGAGGAGAQPPATPQQQGPQQQGPQQGHLRGNGRIVPRRMPPVVAPRTTFRFKGQMPGERVIWVRRQSRLYLVASFAPLLLLALGLFLLRLVVDRLPGGNVILLIGAGVLALFTIRWLFTDFWNWFFLYYILTDQRVIRSEGYFNRQTGEIPLKSVAQVRVERPNVFMVLLRIGNVVVRPVGTELTLAGLDRPRDVADTILAVQEDPKFGLPPEARNGEPVPQVQNPKLRKSLEELAQPNAMPGVPETRVSAPFASFLHRKIPIHFIEGEQVVRVVYRHWWVLVRNEIPALIILIVGVGLGLLLRAGTPNAQLPLYLIAGGIALGLGVAVLIYLNWADDVFVLTTHRVIDIDRLVFLLEEYSNDAPYARIQNVRVERNFWGRFLGYGSIVVETSGRKNPVRMDNIPSAFRVMDTIFAQINLQRERDAVAAVNKQKKENYKWLATVLTDLVLTVPDLRGLSLLEAAGQARKVGLKLVVETERPARGVASGTVLEQMPEPGTSAVADGEVRVVLAGQGVPVAAP